MIHHFYNNHILTQPFKNFIHHMKMEEHTRLFYPHDKNWKIVLLRVFLTFKDIWR